MDDFTLEKWMERLNINVNSWYSSFKVNVLTLEYSNTMDGCRILHQLIDKWFVIIPWTLQCWVLSYMLPIVPRLQDFAIIHGIMGRETPGIRNQQFVWFFFFRLSEHRDIQLSMFVSFLTSKKGILHNSRLPAVVAKGHPSKQIKTTGVLNPQLGWCFTGSWLGGFLSVNLHTQRWTKQHSVCVYIYICNMYIIHVYIYIHTYVHQQ